MANNKKKTRKPTRGPATARVEKPTAQSSKAKGPPRQRSSDRWSWYVLCAGAAGIVALIGFFIFSAASDQVSGDGGRASWDLPGLFDEDERVRLVDLEGKPTVVNFFASWCINCERELPDFTRAATEFGDDVNFVFVHSQETSSSSGRTFARRFGLEDFTVVSDVGSSRSQLSANHGARGLPMTVFYDADGTWRDPLRGELNYDQLVQLMTEAGYLDS
jgi:cytochrome c biogenesis protein CcmG/thiol:disulfide interchange protein DsbE